MPTTSVDIQTFLQLAKEWPVCDARSPAEYAHAHIPGAYSLPIFSDEERKIIGTAYKQQSREKAIRIGLDYFGPKMTTLLADGEKIVEQHREGKQTDEKKILLHCWRGGMRSAAMAWLFSFYGYEVILLIGGYKAYRHQAIESFSKPYDIRILGGYTGTGKTYLLHLMRERKVSLIDLEGLACHRGSAFGATEQEPPSQEMFENLLAQELSSVDGSAFWLEDESQRIGNLIIPNEFWATMRQSPVYFLEISFDDRLKRIVDEYSKTPDEDLIQNIKRISKRLGPLQTKLALQLLDVGEIELCFDILLRYYDKVYRKALTNRQENVGVTKIKFDGYDKDEILNHLSSLD